MQADYVEYVMRPTVSTYHYIQMKGIKFLRNIYIASGFSIKPKTRLSKIEALEEVPRMIPFTKRHKIINPKRRES